MDAGRPHGRGTTLEWCWRLVGVQHINNRGGERRGATGGSEASVKDLLDRLAL